MPAAPEVADALLRALALLAAAGAAGLAWFRLTAAAVQPSLLSGTAARWCGATLLFGAMHVLAQPARFTGEFADTFAAEWLQIALHSAFGAGAALRLGGLLLSAASLLLCGVQARAAAGAGLLLFAAGHALTGHAASSTFGGVLPQLGYGAHLVLFAVWWGALLGLQVSGRRLDTSDFASALERFSATAIWWFPLLPLGGLWLAWWLLGGWPATFTLYAALLAAKLLLVTVVLTLAALNRWRWTPRATAGDTAARHAARHAIRGEIALVAAIVLLTVVMTSWSAPQEAAY